MPNTLRMFRKLSRWPAGRWLFTRAVCWKAPYFASIKPLVEALEPGRCSVRLRDRRRVHNHLGTIHAIALCNAAELAGGLGTEVSIPASMRWIPKGMTVRYLKKARGTLAVIADIPALADANMAQELVARVAARDAAGDTVFEADIAMWVSPRNAGVKG